MFLCFVFGSSCIRLCVSDCIGCVWVRVCLCVAFVFLYLACVASVCDACVLLLAVNVCKRCGILCA